MAAGGKEAISRGAAAAAVGVLVVAVVAMLIVPLPTALVDLLITLNLGAAVTLLLGAAYARGPLSLAGFPTLLVLSTLFRLALNVATVRLILLQADAGQVVRAFGGFVVRGDYVVGAALFLILTVVQYVVIARGAERVAEVGARFALDAMPGRQLAIDADLRARTIDPGEARRRRDALQREAQLYGALDGAMRFVKGDAVAAIVILCISLVGGLAIGALRQGMPIAEAARLYTLLTIGDGLASQIPALLGATAAGLLVTRVAPAVPQPPSAEEVEEGGSLGRELARQFLGQPRILLAVAGLLAALALVGLPPLPFLVGAALFSAAGLARLRAAASRPPAAGLSPLPAAPPALELSLPPAQAGRPAVRATLDGALAALATELGVPLPPLHLRPATGAPTLRMHDSEVELPLAPAAEAQAIAAAVVAVVRRGAALLVGIDETERLLEALSLRCPALCREVVPRRVNVATLAEVLRRLLEEGVAVGDLRQVLEAMAAGPLPRPDEGEADPTPLAERVRRALAPRLSRQVAPAGRAEALLLDPLVEEAVREAARPARALALEPAIVDEILEALRAAARGAGERVPLLLVPGDVRPHLARLAHEAVPGVRVVAYEELLGDVEVIEVGRIGAGPVALPPSRPPASRLPEPPATLAATVATAATVK